MARVSVEVPAELVDAIHETVLLLYGATAESLQLALKARAREDARPEEADAGADAALEEIDAHRARLADLDALLHALGGRGSGAHAEARARGPHAGARAGARGGRSVCVAAPRDLLHDALYGALIDAGERLAELSNRCWRGELPLDDVQAAAEEVLAIDRLLRQLGEGPARA